MKKFKNILVAIDTRSDAHLIVDEAVEIAKHNGGVVKVVDIVPDLSWSARLALQDHEHVSQLLRDEKLEKLNSIVASHRDQGVEVTAKVLQGKTSVEIIREVMRSNHDLVLRATKGKDSRRNGFFGTTGIGLMRKCPCAVWLVHEGSIACQRVLGCLDTSSEDPLDAELNHRVLELSQSVADWHQGTYSLLHAWSLWNEPMLRHRMDADEFAALEKTHRNRVDQQLHEFLQKSNVELDEQQIHLVEGEPSEAIATVVSEQSIDLVVMGTVARSGVAGMVMGNTAEHIINRLQSSILALKPSNFQSPIQLDD